MPIKYTNTEDKHKTLRDIVVYLVPGLVAGGAGGPVLTALNVQPDTARPLALAVAVQVRHQLAHLRSRAGGAGGAYKNIHNQNRKSAYEKREKKRLGVKMTYKGTCRCLWS